MSISFVNGDVMKRIAVILVVALIFVSSGATAWASLETVNWNADNTNDGSGTGVLAGTINVTYSSASGFNSGQSLFENWASYLGTAAATGGSVSYQSGGILGGAAAGTTETITFSSSVAQPILLVNWLGYSGRNSDDVFNFGSNTFTLLSSYGATSLGTVVSGVGDTDTTNDGFGIQFQGTFGPGAPLVFTYTSDGTGTNGLQTVGFTIGTVPEPATIIIWSLLGMGSWLGMKVVRRRRVGPAGRRSWSPENRQAIHDIISRG